MSYKSQMIWKTAGSMPSLTISTMLLKPALLVREKKIAAFNYRAVQVNGAVVDQVKVATVIEVNVACHLNKQVVTEQNGSVVVQMNREAQS